MSCNGWLQDYERTTWPGIRRVVGKHERQGFLAGERTHRTPSMPSSSSRLGAASVKR